MERGALRDFAAFTGFKGPKTKAFFFLIECALQVRQGFVLAVIRKLNVPK